MWKKNEEKKKYSVLLSKWLGTANRSKSWNLFILKNGVFRLLLPIPSLLRNWDKRMDLNSFSKRFRFVCFFFFYLFYDFDLLLLQSIQELFFFASHISMFKIEFLWSRVFMPRKCWSGSQKITWAFDLELTF